MNAYFWRILSAPSSDFPAHGGHNGHYRPDFDLSIRTTSESGMDAVELTVPSSKITRSAKEKPV
jgi:hypothetical protein